MKGGLLNVIGHWRLGEHSKQHRSFPALLLYCSPGSYVWATTRNRTVTEINVSLTTEKKIARAKLSFLMREVKQKSSFWQAYDRESYLDSKRQPKEAVASLGQTLDCLGWIPLLRLWFSTRTKILCENLKNIFFPSVSYSSVILTW